MEPVKAAIEIVTMPPKYKATSILKKSEYLPTAPLTSIIKKPKKVAEEEVK